MTTEEPTTYAATPPISTLAGGTMGDVFLRGVAENPGPAAHRRRSDGSWEAIERAEVGERVLAIAAALRHMGCRPGDRVAILSHTRFEWALADWATLVAGCVVVTVYPSLPADQIRHILADSGARWVFAEDDTQLAKLRDVVSVLPSLEQAVVFEPVAETPPGALLPVLGLTDLAAIGRDCSARATIADEAANIAPEALATLVYTSGTTGVPKGVMLTHANLYANTMQCASVLPISSNDLALSWLPLSHAFERMAGHFLLWATGARIAYAESTETVARDMEEVAPTLIIGVPRLYEKFYEAVVAAVERGGAPKKAIFAFATRVGRTWTDRKVARRSIGPLLAAGHSVADRLVFSKLRARTGGRVRVFVSGAAPLSPDINRFFFAAGMTVLEGYGLTETSPVTNVNLPDDIRFGTVGPPLPGTEVRIADDGEVCFRGPQVMAGYYGNEAATADALDADGWLHTGDIGRLDADGYLTITDRKKNLIVTAAGKNVSPAALEERLSRSPLVENVVLIGDRRKFTIVLAVPTLEALRRAFPGRDIGEEDRAALTLDPVTTDLLEADLLPRVASFARHERPKLVVPIPEPPTVDNGMLTPSLKVKRRAVTEAFAELIDRRYEEAEQEYDERGSDNHG